MRDATPIETAEYLTVEQVADWLQVSEKSVYRWTADPTMPVLRISRTVRFPKARLAAWLKAREQGAGRARRYPKPVPSAPQSRAESTSRAGPAAPCAIPCATEGQRMAADGRSDGVGRGAR